MNNKEEIEKNLKSAREHVAIAEGMLAEEVTDQEVLAKAAVAQAKAAIVQADCMAQLVTKILTEAEEEKKQ